MMELALGKFIMEISPGKLMMELAPGKFIDELTKKDKVIKYLNILLHWCTVVVQIYKHINIIVSVLQDLCCLLQASVVRYTYMHII